MLGPTLVRRAARIVRGDNVDEVHLVFKGFEKCGTTGTMIDVGAHRGGSLVPFAAAGSTVFAFEPDIQNRIHLARLVRKYPNVSIDPRGVSDRANLGASFYTSGVSSGISSLSSFHYSHHESQKIDVTTLREFVSERNITEIAFLKIDVEGHDLFVLQGFPWDRILPECIVCEYENRKTEPNGYDLKTLHRFLDGKGYEVVISEWFPITEYGSAHRWKAFRDHPDRVDPHSWGNLVALRRDGATSQAVRRQLVVTPPGRGSA